MSISITILLIVSPIMKKPTTHWWQNVLSISSSSKSDEIDSISGKRISLKSSLFSRSRRNSRHQKQSCRKLRHDGLWPTSENSPARSVSESSLPAPQPLPVPDLGPLLRRDTKFPSHRSNPDNVPLPSPSHRELHLGGEKDRRKAKNLNVDVNHALERRRKSRSGSEVLEYISRMAIQDGVNNMEDSDTSRRSTQKLNGLGGIPNDYHMNFASSAPTSPYSTPLLSPHICNRDASIYQIVTPPSLFQVWSAPEMPSPDSVKCSGSSVKCPVDVTAQGVDNPSIHSPRLIPHQNCRNSNGPPSPLSNKLISENQIVSRDSNCQASVHPLPLPPGGGTPLQHIPITPIPAKSDLLPIQSQWQKGKLLGRGTFGSVYVASNKETGALCAMKEVEILQDDPKSAECIRQLEQEIEVLSHLKHPNIVQYYGSERVGDRFYIYLEYVHPGSINNFIRDHCGAITESVVRNFTRHILSGLAYLHSTKTIHRDIKGANLLVDAYGVVKLADFGMAKHLTGQAAYLSLKGSPYWMAPELLQSVMQKDDNVELALAIDIWSLGCTIIEMLNGKPPWSELEGPAAMFKALKENPPIPENLSAEGKDFLRCCFFRNPAERPTAAMLLEHRFVNNPHSLDLLSGRSGVMELTDKEKSQRTFLPRKLDQVLALSDTETTKREIG